MTDFDIVSEEAIAAGDATDAYFDRTVETLENADLNPHVTAEVTATQYPTGEWQVFAGLKDVAHLLEGLDVDVYALREGQLFDGGPVLVIEGSYLEFCRMETSLIGFLSKPTGFATAALETKRAAGDATIFSFGARHLHPSVTAALERSALIGGVDGFSHVAAGEEIGREAGGTMPHALIICFGQGEQEAAWQAFDEAVGPSVPRVALADTYNDEVDESIRAAEAVEDLDSVRLDTTSSRRGDFEHIVREVRQKLDARGHEDVGIFASGAIGPDIIHDIRDVAAGFGVGTYISDASNADFSLDIVQREGEWAVKRGKLDGRKEVYRTPEGGHEVRRIEHAAPENSESLLQPLIEDGEIVRDFDIDAAARRAREDADLVGFDEANLAGVFE